MGRITDWAKVFENIGYLYYEAFLAKSEKDNFFKGEDRGEERELVKKLKLPALETVDEEKTIYGLEKIRDPERIHTRNEAEKWERKANWYIAAAEKEKDKAKAEAKAVGLYALEEEGERQLYKITELENRFLQIEKAVTNDRENNRGIWENEKTAFESLGREALIEEGENKKILLERLLYGNTEKSEEIYKISGYRYEAVKKEREKILSGGQASQGEDKRDIRIEMHNVNNVTGEADIDKITDMLTGRLCELMQKSADGFYM